MKNPTSLEERLLEALLAPLTCAEAPHPDCSPATDRLGSPIRPWGRRCTWPICTRPETKIARPAAPE